MRKASFLGPVLIIVLAIGALAYMGSPPQTRTHRSQQEATELCRSMQKGYALPQETRIEGAHADDPDGDKHSFYPCQLGGEVDANG